MENNQLSDVLEFTPEDLAANSTGHLSDNQRADLKHKQWTWFGFTAFLLLLAILAFDTVRLGADIEIGEVIMLALVIATIRTAVIWWRYRSDLQSPVCKVVGESYAASLLNYGQKRRFTVGTVQFVTYDDMLIQAFQGEGVYRV